MNENIKTNNSSRNVIGILEVLLILKNNYKKIILFILIGMIISAIISTSLMKMNYKAEKKVNLAIPSVLTVEGVSVYLSDYPLLKFSELITKDEILLDALREFQKEGHQNPITKEELKQYVSVKVVGNELTISVKTDNPEKSTTLLEKIYHSFIVYTEMFIREKVIVAMEEKAIHDLKNEEEKLEVLQKVYSEPESNDKNLVIKDSLVEYDILKTIVSIDLYKKQLEHIYSESQLIELFKQKKDYVFYEQSTIHLLENYLYPLEVEEDFKDQSMQTIEFLAIGATVGLCIGITFVLLKELWILKKQLIKENEI